MALKTNIVTLRMSHHAACLHQTCSTFNTLACTMCNNVLNVQHFFEEFRCCTLGYNRCNAFRRTKSTELNPRNLDFNRLSVEVIFTKISADLNEENNVIRLHLRRTERVLSEREARYFEVSAFLHT